MSWVAGINARGNARVSLLALIGAAVGIFVINVATANAAVTASNDAAAVAGAITTPGLQTGASFTVAGPVAECANGIDDDTNGLVDAPNDPGCTNAADDTEEAGFGANGDGDFGMPECQNGYDDDGDSKTDFTGYPGGGDPQCASATDADEALAGDQQTECETAADDDGEGDGGTFGTDPNCTAADDDDEFAPTEQCSDGIDNDAQGGTDLADPGCSFPYDNDESSNNPVSAGANKAAGISDVPLAGFPRDGSTFAVLTSGDAELADDPNTDGGSGASNGGQAYGEAYDPLTLKIDINVPAGANCVAFDFRFLSEEYPEFVNAGFNDAFVAQLDNLSINVSGNSITAPGDFAAGAGDQISVDSSGPSGMNDTFASGTTYDGATPRLVARTPVSPGAHSVFLTIFDAGDHILDSAVFVDNMRTTTEAPGQCKSLAAEPFEGKTGVAFAASGGKSPFDFIDKLNQMVVNLLCNLPSGNELACQIAMKLLFSPAQPGGGGKRVTYAAKPVPLASGSATIPAGESQAVTLPTTPAGKKAVQAAIDRPKQLLKKAKKLLKKAQNASPSKAEKLIAKAKKLKKQAKKLKKAPLGIITAEVTNPQNGATETLTFEIPR